MARHQILQKQELITIRFFPFSFITWSTDDHYWKRLFKFLHHCSVSFFKFFLKFFSFSYFPTEGDAQSILLLLRYFHRHPCSSFPHCSLHPWQEPLLLSPFHAGWPSWPAPGLQFVSLTSKKNKKIKQAWEGCYRTSNEKYDPNH